MDEQHEKMVMVPEWAARALAEHALDMPSGGRSVRQVVGAIAAIERAIIEQENGGDDGSDTGGTIHLHPGERTSNHAEGADELREQQRGVS